MTEQEDEQLWYSYFYPGTEVFINQFDERDPERLKEIEATITFQKLLELREKPLELGCGKDHLNAIHRYVFGEIYPFAGEYRKVNMRKARGVFFFLHGPHDMDEQLDSLFSEVEEAFNHCHSKVEFCDLLGKLYTSLIYDHPYREGNGRVIREFLREFSIQKSQELGFGTMEIDWSKIDHQELNRHIEVSHLFPSSTTMLFMDALVEVDDSKKASI